MTDRLLEHMNSGLVEELAMREAGYILEAYRQDPKNVHLKYQASLRSQAVRQELEKRILEILAS